MGPVDLKGRIETTMEASTSKDHKDKNKSNHDGKFDMDVDIINCTSDDTLIQTQSGDATCSSSSFGDTFSETGNREYESDDEVVSELRGFGGSDDLLMRKKRLTSHWRKFVQPLMWRCKWVELQIKKFQSQANKYDKELEKRYQTKELKHGNFELEGLCAKSLPFSLNSQREKPMKRKNRKRYEESDTEAYMSQHNLFSYFATQRSTVGGATMDDDQTNLAAPTDKNIGNEFRVPDELLSLDFRDDYSLEQILWKIEVAQTQVCEMKTRLNTVMTENEEKFLCTEELSLHESNNNNINNNNNNDDDNNMVTCSVSPTNKDVSSVGASFASQLMKYNKGDFVNSESAASSHGEGTNLRDVNEHMDQPPVASRKRTTDGILIYNRRAKKPLTDSGDVKIHPIENLRVPSQGKNDDTALVSVSEDSSKNDQPAPKLRSVSKLTAPNNKKKRAARARRKSGSSLWSRRTSA